LRFFPVPWQVNGLLINTSGTFALLVSRVLD